MISTMLCFLKRQFLPAGKFLRGRKLSVICILPLHVVILIEGRRRHELSPKEAFLVLAEFKCEAIVRQQGRVP